MINAPGYYSLPLVYGNARNNPNAYTCMSTPAEGMNDYVLMNFVGIFVSPSAVDLVGNTHSKLKSTSGTTFMPEVLTE